MKHFLDVTTETSAAKRLSSLSSDVLVIYSPTALMQVGNLRSKGTFISTHSIGKDAEILDKLYANHRASKIVALGGGTAIDIAKYLSTLTSQEFICIPTMLSTNAFATNKVALMRNGIKITHDAKLPDEVILDPELVLKAGTYNLYGLCDILSIHTALEDWTIADRAGIEKIDADIFFKSQKLLEETIRLAAHISKPTISTISALFTVIGEAGHITNLYGTGRPESGSEHILAKEVECKVEVPHGISIAIGIILMSILQNNISTDIENALNRTGVLRAIVENYDLFEAVKMSLEGVQPRPDRYTVLDEKRVGHEEAECMAHDLYRVLRGYL